MREVAAALPANPLRRIPGVAIMLGLLTVGINLTADAYARTLGKSD